MISARKAFKKAKYSKSTKEILNRIDEQIKKAAYGGYYQITGVLKTHGFQIVKDFLNKKGYLVTVRKQTAEATEVVISWGYGGR
jgi:hypothetical protein